MTMALDGLRVLDFSRLLPGPYCTSLLADMGAEVIRIENPRELAKQAKIFGWDSLSADGVRQRREQDMLARNKRSVMLDIGNPAAQTLLRNMAATVDVVVEDYRPGVLAGLGLGYDDLARSNPRLVGCSLTLCGQTGPYRDKPGHDPIALALSGVMARTGEDPGKPGFPGVPMADIVTGTHAAFGILAALRARDRDGLGQHIDIAMTDCSMTLLANLVSRHRDLEALPPRGTRRADMGLWRCADGLYLCTTDMEPRYWLLFCETVGHPEFASLQTDVAARPLIRRTLDEVMATRPRSEWMALMEAAGTQFAPVHTVAEAMADAHVLARGMSVEVEGETGRPVRQLGLPVKLSRTPGAIRNLGGPPGDDTQDVLGTLGLGAEDLDRLRVAGAFGPVD